MAATKRKPLEADSWVWTRSYGRLGSKRETHIDNLRLAVLGLLTLQQCQRQRRTTEKHG
ncbi:MAG: hypothetical protein ACFB8W_19510 [Elainellaceae cyanobacterium]